MIKKIRKAALNYIPVLSRAWLIYRAPFLFNMLEIQPSSAIVMITNRCNLRCVMCRQWRQPHGPELSTDEWKEAIRALGKNGIKNIHFTGGEPLLRTDLKELISFASSGGFVVGMTTNGSLLNRDLLEGLVDEGLRSVALSVDATGKEYDIVRGVSGSFEKVKAALEAISCVRKKRRLDAYVNFTLMKNNPEEMRRVKELSDAAGLPLHVCLLDKNSSIFNIAENEENFRMISDADKKPLDDALNFLKNEKMKNPGSLINNFPGIDFIREYFKDPRQKWIPCIVSQDRIFIDPSGNMSGGCLSMGKFNNIRGRGLEELKKDRRYRQAKRKMFYKNCPGCSCGYFFNISHFVPCVVRDVAARFKYSLGPKDAI